MSQEDLAEHAEMSCLGGVERGDKRSDLTISIQIANGLNVDRGDLPAELTKRRARPL